MPFRRLGSHFAKRLLHEVIETVTLTKMLIVSVRCWPDMMDMCGCVVVFEQRRAYVSMARRSVAAGERYSVIPGKGAATVTTGMIDECGSGR